MNIAIIHNNFPAGGAEMISVDIAEYLSSCQGEYKVFVYCRRCDENKFTDRIRNNITVRQTRHSHFGRYKDVLELIKQDKIDIVLMAVKFMSTMPKIQKKTGVKVIYANHGQPFWQQFTIALDKERKSPFLWKLYRRNLYINKGLALKKSVDLTRKWYENCDVYTVLCQAYKEQTEKMLNIRAEESHIIAIENSEEAVKDICWEKEKTILYCGRVVYDIKRVDRLLYIWKRIQNELPDYRLQIVGDGPGMKMCKDIVEKEHLERVVFEGYQTDVNPYFKKASIVCLTSQAEGWGLTLTEGQAHGCIAVAFNCSSGVEELLSPNGKCGFLVPNEDEEGYAKQLLQIARLPEEEKMKIRKAAVEKRLQYTPERISVKWKKLFDRLMDKTENK